MIILSNRMQELGKKQREYRMSIADDEEKLKALKPQIKKLKNGLGKIQVQRRMIQELSELSGEQEVGNDLKTARIREHNITLDLKAKEEQEQKLILNIEKTRRALNKVNDSKTVRKYIESHARIWELRLKALNNKISKKDVDEIYKNLKTCKSIEQRMNYDRILHSIEQGTYKEDTGGA